MSGECVVIDFPAQVDVALEEVARTLFAAGLTPSGVTVNFDVTADDNETVTEVAKHWPDVSWLHDYDGYTEWSEAYHGPIRLRIESPMRDAGQSTIRALIEGATP